MALLPLIYLFWWKKKWRLLLGISILAIAVIGIFSPGEITYSILVRNIERVSKIKEKKINDLLNKAASEKITDENKEKNEYAQKIIELNKQLKELKEELKKSRQSSDYQTIWSKQLLTKIQREKRVRFWISKWSQEKYLSALLFGGEEFNQKLLSKKYQFGGQEKKNKISTESVINFADYSTSKPEEVKEKILEIIKKAEVMSWNNSEEEFFAVVLFLNVDKITNPELENLLVKVFDPQTEESFWKYKDEENREITPDLRQLVFIVTTSKTNSKLPKDLQKKLHHIEPLLDKYFWWFFLASATVTIIILVILIKRKRKSDNEALKQLAY